MSEKFDELLGNLTEVDIMFGGPARAAMVEYVTGLEEEVERLREEIDAIGKACHKDMVILGRLYLEVKELKAENARLREAARWIPVEERLPEKGDVVLAVSRIGKVEIRHTDYYTDINTLALYNSHWRALPEPPEVE